jgi:hypothetical protein
MLIAPSLSHARTTVTAIKSEEVITEDKASNAGPKVVLDKHKEDAKIFRRYDILRKCHQAKDRCRFDDQCCINLECVRENPKDKYGRCKNIEDW